MQTLIALLTITMLMLGSSGCAPSWKMTKGEFRARGYEIKTPLRWMLINNGNSVLVSDHGPQLESILIRRHSIEDDKTPTPLTLRPGMLPHEVGELIINHKRVHSDVTDVQIVKVSVATVGGKEAVRVEMDYRQNGFVFSDIVYAVPVAKWLYEIRYSAAKRYYYQASLGAFEELIGRFRFF